MKIIASARLAAVQRVSCCGDTTVASMLEARLDRQVATSL